MTPEAENVWRTLKDELPIVTSFWCRLKFHKWTKWHTEKEANEYIAGKGNYIMVRQRRACVHCNTLEEQILQFKNN